MNRKHGFYQLERQAAKDWPPPYGRAYLSRLAELRKLVDGDDPGHIRAGMLAQLARVEVLVALIGLRAVAQGATGETIDVYIRAEGLLSRIYGQAGKALGRKPQPRVREVLVAEVEEVLKPPPEWARFPLTLDLPPPMSTCMSMAASSAPHLRSSNA